MVFQPSGILNRCLSALVAVLFSLLAGPACYAEGFPGRGNPQDWSAALPYYNLGNKYMQQERYEDAIQKYHEAIGRYEYDPDFFNNLGVALRKVENFEAAEQAFKSAAALNAKDWMSWSNLANSYLKQDRLEDTVKAFEQALKCNPPAQEKEAILKDIADIKKILSVRNGDVQPPPVKTPAAKIVGSGKTSKNTGSLKPATPLRQIGTAKNAPAGTPAVAAPVEKSSGLVRQNAREAKVPKQNTELNGTGWEEVAK